MSIKKLNVTGITLLRVSLEQIAHQKPLLYAQVQVHAVTKKDNDNVRCDGIGVQTLLEKGWNTLFAPCICIQML